MKRLKKQPWHWEMGQFIFNFIDLKHFLGIAYMDFFKQVLLLRKQFLILAGISASIFAKAQTAEIKNILADLNKDSLVQHGLELTGKKAVVINGDTVFIKSRYADNPGNVVAKKYLFQKLKSYGLTPTEQNFDFTGNNIYAIQKGTTDPKKCWIICAHYDDKSFEGSPAGADDNASGTAAVLEIARVLSTKAFPYTIIYALWDNEEQNLDGSRYFVENNPLYFDQIQCVINLDMIGWDKDSDYVFEIHVREVGNSIGIGQNIVKLNNDYTLGLLPNTVNPGNGSSDQAAFWQGGIPAVAFYENGNDFNPYYHKLSDSVYYLNKEYWFKLTNLACASIATFATQGEQVSIQNDAEKNVSKIKASPNPFSEKINIGIENQTAGKVIVTVYNILGKKADELIFRHNGGNNEFLIDAKSYANGMYVLKIEFTGKDSEKPVTETLKMIKHD